MGRVCGGDECNSHGGFQKGRRGLATTSGLYPYRCDYPRVVEAGLVLLLPPALIVMRHFNWVRHEKEGETLWVSPS